MTRLVLKKPLKIEGVRFAEATLPAGTEIEITDRHTYVTHYLKCRIILAKGVEYAVYEAEIDAARKGDLGCRAVRHL